MAISIVNGCTKPLITWGPHLAVIIANPKKNQTDRTHINRNLLETRKIWLKHHLRHPGSTVQDLFGGYSIGCNQGKTHGY